MTAGEAKLEVVCGHCDAVVGLAAERVKDAPRCPRCHNPLFAGTPLTLTAANFDRHVTRGSLPVVVDFWAPWCQPCLSMAPHFEAAARKLEPRLRFAKLDTEAHQQPAARFAIRSIPTLIVFRAGQELARQSGALDAGALARWLEPVLRMT
jgi:thioredoxin 2